MLNELFTTMYSFWIPGTFWNGALIPAPPTEYINFRELVSDVFKFRSNILAITEIPEYFTLQVPVVGLHYICTLKVLHGNLHHYYYKAREISSRQDNGLSVQLLPSCVISNRYIWGVYYCLVILQKKYPVIVNY